MYRQNLLFLALLTAFASNAIAQVQTQVKAPGCDAIPRLGLRNIQVQYSTEAAVATAFFTRCDTTNYRDYYTDGPPDPAWCEDQDRLQQAETHRGEFLAVLGIYGSAVNAWKRCRESANSGLQITPEIAPDARTVNIQLEGVDPKSASDSETTPDTTEFLGIQHENFRCVVLVPTQRTDKEDSLDRGESYIRELRPNRNRTLREVNKTLRENRNSSNRQTVTVHCERTAPRKEPGGLLGGADSTAFDVLDSGIISILTTAGSMQLYFAEESLPSVASEQALEARMENFESWLPPAAPDPDQQTLRESLATLADSVWDLNTGQSQLYVRQHTLALHLDSLALRVTDLNTGQSQLYVRQDTLSADQNSLAARQDSLEARYERLNKLVAALRQDSLTAVRTYAADANAGADRALKELKLRNSVVLGVLTAAAGVLIGLLIGDG